MTQIAAQSYVLPSAIVSRADLARLVREIETIDGDLESQKVKAEAAAEGGAVAKPKLPVLSRGLADFLELNKQDLLKDQERMALKEQLRKLKDLAPMVHMTFAVEADPESLQTLVAWLRENAHPQALLSVGLQPSLIGGVYLRTPNHVHDFTMKALFSGKREIVAEHLERLNNPQVVPAPPVEAPAAAAPAAKEQT